MAPLKLISLALLPAALAIGTPATIDAITDTSIPHILPGGPSGISLAPGPAIVTTRSLVSGSDMSVPSGGAPTRSGANTMITATPATGSTVTGAAGASQSGSAAVGSASASIRSAASSLAASASSVAGAAGSAVSGAASAASSAATAGAVKDQQVAMGALAGALGLAMLI